MFCLEYEVMDLCHRLFHSRSQASINRIAQISDLTGTVTSIFGLVLHGAGRAATVNPERED